MKADKASLDAGAYDRAAFEENKAYGDIHNAAIRRDFVAIEEAYHRLRVIRRILGDK